MDFEASAQQILAATRKVVLNSSKLPNPGADYSLKLSVPAVRGHFTEKRTEVLKVIEQMFEFLNVKVSLGSLLGDNQWQDDAEIEDFLDILIDANDQVFESIGDSLDTAAGLKKTPELVIVNLPKHRFRKPAANSLPFSENKPASNGSETGKSNSQGGYRLFAAKIVERPQLKFPDKIDNSNGIFVPRLRSKPNALRSFDDSFVRLDDGEGSYLNPYSFELQSLAVNEEFIKPSSYDAPKSLEDTPLLIVADEEQFAVMLKDLEIASEIAVDLEHHSYRSFQGFTCLLQISTRLKDYIIDTLALRGQIAELLPIFTNPSVLKVFHGAEMDIKWLQRDFGVYVVNMFDSYVAAKTLGFPKFSLAYLLDRYLHVDVDKQFQLADWRIRPLPEELVKYARSDTHYLLHLCDLMKNDLTEKAKMEESNDVYCLVKRVFDESSTVCSLHYEKRFLADLSHLELYERSRKVFNSQQMMALKLLFAWRDAIARREDESVGYVLPNHMLFQMAELLPKEPTGVLACCQPIPPLVKQQCHEIHGLILQARRQPLQQVDNPAVAAAKAHFVSTQRMCPELEALSSPLDVTAKIPERLDIVVGVAQPSPTTRRRSTSNKFSSFLRILLPQSSQSVKVAQVKAKDALMNRTMTLFHDYALRSQDLPHSEKKVLVAKPMEEPTALKQAPLLKRSVSAVQSQGDIIRLDPVPSSSSPPKRFRAKKSASTTTMPLVSPSTRSKKRRRGKKFVENVVVVSDDDGQLEEGQLPTPAKRKSPRVKSSTQRRDFHEKRSRQMKTFPASRKSGGRGK